ncbi:MAG: lipoprotein signal peptidase [Bacteroidales bacterium]|jgi:signal peptidase II|nr:lipoprotein signal peptidase [Bacteroidales bacterium]
MKRPLILIFAILLADQVLKIWIKLSFPLGQEINLIGDWCRLHFIENKGMAFGMAFGGEAGKIVLTSLRIVASVLIFIYLQKLVRKRESKWLIYGFALIFCGAVGNVIDSLFYGVLFSESTIFAPAVFMPDGGGYAPMFLGKVVDMFYFPLIDTEVFGHRVSFFNAIFNVADASITTGVVLLMIYFLFLHKNKPSKAEIATENSEKPIEINE